MRRWEEDVETVGMKQGVRVAVAADTGANATVTTTSIAVVQNLISGMLTCDVQYKRLNFRYHSH
jgi:hypothetical protein